MSQTTLPIALGLLLASCVAQAIGPGDNAYSMTETRRQTSREASDSQHRTLFSRTVTPTLQILRSEGKLAAALYQQPEKILLQHFENGHLVVWDFARGAQIGGFPLPKTALAVHYRPESGELLYLQGQKLWLLKRAEGAQPVEWLRGKSIAAATASMDGKLVVAMTTDGNVLSLKRNGTANWQNAWRQAGETLSELSVTAEGDPLLIAHSGKAYRVSSSGSREIETQPPGRKIVSLQQGTGGAASLTLEHGTLTLQRGAEKLKVDDDVRYVSAAGGKRYLYLKNDGQTYICSTDRDDYLLTLVSTPLGWVVVDHEGRYDGTVAGTKDVAWKAGDQQMTLDQFFDNYYKTGLLADYMNDKDGKLRQVPARIREGVFLPPKIDIDFPDGKLKPGQENKIIVVADSRGGDLNEEIRVFYNGKRLPAKARIGSQKVQREEQVLLAEIFAFTPEGGANEIFAETGNMHGIVGRSAVKKEISEGFRSPGKLQMLIIGVDQYRQRELDLDFSKADATTLSKAIDQGATPVYGSVQQQMLLDKNATKAGILQAMSALENVAAQDSLVVILAGHGVLEGDEWYFLPHDVNTRQIAQTGIAAKALQEALVNSPAKRIFLMVDACHSGGGVDTFNQYRDFQRRFAQQLGRSAGITVLTAARRDQLAAEAAQLGHGLFSYVALEGLKGAADTSPRDGTITAHELAAYVGERMPQHLERMTEQRGIGAGSKDAFLQAPAYFVIGADFPVSGKAN